MDSLRDRIAGAMCDAFYADGGTRIDPPEAWNAEADAAIREAAKWVRERVATSNGEPTDVCGATLLGLADEMEGKQ